MPGQDIYAGMRHGICLRNMERNKNLHEQFYRKDVVQMKTKKYISAFLCFFLVFVLLTSNAALASNIAPLAVLKTESESNNTRATANSVNQDDTITGYISSSSDVDYFKVTASANGVFNFWLGNIPSGKDYDLYIYNSSGFLLGSSTSTSATQEFVSGITATKGNTYYFAVKGKSGHYSATSAYTVRCRILMNPYTGFSQSSPANSATSFTTTNLDKLYSSGSSTSWLTRFKNAGCIIGSYAMILRNLGATTSSTHYDFRSGVTGHLTSDPFTVMLANTSWPTISANTNGTYTAATTQDSVYTYHGRIASGFGKTVSQVSLSELSTGEKANAIAYYLSLHPEGVAVSFQSGTRTHTIVFIQTTVEIPSTYSPPSSTVLAVTNYEIASEISEVETQGVAAASASDYDNSFTVCDPSGTTYYGAPQSFGTSYAASSYGFSTAYRILFFS